MGALLQSRIRGLFYVPKTLLLEQYVRMGPTRPLKFLGSKIADQKQAQNPPWESSPTEISYESIILGKIYRLVKNFGRRPSDRGF